MKLLRFRQTLACRISMGFGPTRGPGLRKDGGTFHSLSSGTRKLRTKAGMSEFARLKDVGSQLALDLLAITSLQEKRVRVPSSDFVYVASTLSGMSACLIFSLTKSSSMRIFGAIRAFLGYRAKADLCRMYRFHPPPARGQQLLVRFASFARKTSMGCSWPM